MKRLVTALAVLSAGLWPAASSAQEYTFTFATQNIPGTTLARGAQMLVEHVDEFTDGRVELQLNDSLLKGAELAPAIRDGTVEFVAALPIYISAGEPMMGLQNLPGLITERSDYQAALSGGWREELARVWEENWNAIELVEGVFSTNYLLTNKAVLKVEDFGGMQIRVHNPQAAQLMQALGAAPTPLDASEIAAGLERGIIDGLFTGTCLVEKAEHWRYAKFNADWKAGALPGWTFLANKASWEQIPTDLREKIMEAAQSVEKELWDSYDGFVADCVEKLKSHGAEFNEVPEDQLQAALGEENTDPIYQAWIEAANAKGYDGEAFLEKIRSAIQSGAK